MNKFYRKPKPETMKKNRETYAELYKDELPNKYNTKIKECMENGVDVSWPEDLFKILNTKITEEEYNVLTKAMPPAINWSGLQDFEKEDTTSGSKELACTAGVCEIVDIEAS